jgi:carboxyl-terminal processing protease
MTEPARDWFEPSPSSGGRRGPGYPLAMLLLLFAFAGGLLIGQTGLLGAAPGGGALPTPSAGGPTGTPAPGATVAQPADAPADFGLFWQALSFIRQEFVDRDLLTDQQLTYGAIRGLVEALGDTGHTVFLTPEAVQAEERALSGSIVGIGVLLGERDGRPVIVSVISGGPASRAGMRSGDQVVAVDGEDVLILAPEDVAASIRGEAGTIVVVTVERPATGENLDFSMVRETINVPAADWTMVPGTQIALLRLIQFSQGAAAELLATRDAAINEGAQAVIVDLRSNPGGYVDEAVKVASEFLSDSVVYIAENADGSRESERTDPSIQATDLPLVVLIDEGTASSAEIVAGALRSADRGPLIGQTTFGTGTVLITKNLSDGSAIRLAVQRWLTPDGELIFGQGIKPTVEVALAGDQQPLEPAEVRAMTAEQVTTMPDAQLLRAIELLRSAP